MACRPEFFLLGVGPILWVISTATLRQSVTPPSLLGRVSAINIMSYGARPLGSALGAIVGGLYRRGDVPVSGGGHLRDPGAGDPDVTSGVARAAAGDGGRSGGVLMSDSDNAISTSIIPGRSAGPNPE